MSITLFINTLFDRPSIISQLHSYHASKKLEWGVRNV